MREYTLESLYDLRHIPGLRAFGSIGHRYFMFGAPGLIRRLTPTALSQDWWPTEEEEALGFEGLLFWPFTGDIDSAPFKGMLI